MRESRSTGTLESSLRVALIARVPALLSGTVADDAFHAVVHACESADRDYRASIAKHLSPEAAREVLAATDAFRDRVRAVRAGAFAEASRIAPGGASDAGGAVADPLDVVAPRVANLSHVAAVRLADVSDRARAAVAALRSSANARIEPVLTAATRETLIGAKRARLAAFRGAVHAALVPFTSRVERYSDTVESLANLADGWY